MVCRSRAYCCDIVWIPVDIKSRRIQRDRYGTEEKGDGSNEQVVK